MFITLPILVVLAISILIQLVRTKHVGGFLKFAIVFLAAIWIVGIAVQLIGPQADPNAHMGPEAPTSHPAPTSGVEEDQPKATDTTAAPGSPTPPQ